MSAAGTQEFFHGYAADFNAIYGQRNTPFNRLVNGLFRKSMRLRYARTLEGCDPIEGRRVLDIGCGPGHYGIALARRGAAEVVGLDFAEGMLRLAARQAAEAGVAGQCRFIRGDFAAHPFEQPFDYVIAIGFMDYMAAPQAVVQKALSLTRRRAFFSFPLAGGVLAWQRKLRYKYQHRCELYLYTRPQVEALFPPSTAADVRIERLGRDLFVSCSPPRS
jgi:SAM-dependent methyltransferase